MNKTEFAIFFFYLLIVALLTKPYSYGDNEASRFNTIMALVNYHTFAWITYVYNTEDYVLVDGKLYSDKPPVFAFLAAGVYFLFTKLGLTFETHLGLVPYLMKILIIGTTSAYLLVVFYRTLLLHLTKKQALFLTSCLGFSTLLLTYSTAFNSHTVTALLLFWAVSLYLRYQNQNSEKINFFHFGFLLGLAAAFDIIVGFLFLLFFAFYFFFVKKISWNKKLLLCIGAALPVLLHFSFNFIIFGDLLPAYAHPEYFEAAGTWQNQSNLPGFYNHASFKDLLVYTFHSTFGFRGLFSYTPLLFFGFCILFYKIFKEKESTLLPIAFAVIGIIGYYSIYTINYGGASYGSRYLLPLTPILLYFCLFIFLEYPRWKPLFYVCIVFSFAVAVLGAINPWTNIGLGIHQIPILTNIDVHMTYNTAAHYILHYIFS